MTVGTPFNGEPIRAADGEDDAFLTSDRVVRLPRQEPPHSPLNAESLSSFVVTG